MIVLNKIEVIQIMLFCLHTQKYPKFCPLHFNIGAINILQTLTDEYAKVKLMVSKTFFKLLVIFYKN